MAFVANMFNKHPALEEPEEDLGIQETREEKSNFEINIRFNPSKKLLIYFREDWFLMHNFLLF